MGIGIGYGKTILFGEMFAIFGVPVIAAAVSLKAEANFVPTNSGGWDIEDQGHATIAQDASARDPLDIPVVVGNRLDDDVFFADHAVNGQADFLQPNLAHLVERNGDQPVGPATHGCRGIVRG